MPPSDPDHSPRTTAKGRAGTRKPRRLSANHEAVYHALQAAHQPMTAYALIDQLRPQGITAPPTVYRALNRLIRDGLVHRIESLNAFVACSRKGDHDGPVAIAICDGCGNAREFSAAALTALLTDEARAQSFMVEGVLLELRGQCGDCSGLTGQSNNGG